MAERMPPVDVVVVGVGWTGSIIGKELAAAGLKVVALERGRDRQTVPDFQAPAMHDELKYSVQYGLMQDVARETVTFRNHAGETALPYRRIGSFLPGTGVGGAGVHWSGAVYRYTESDFKLRSHYTDRYGPDIFAADLTVQDWPLTYAELEPSYDRFERLCGIGGQAGNIGGKLQPGGNPFEAPRSRDFPNPPMTMPYASALFGKAAAELGYHPFPQPSANMSAPYVNSEGLQLHPCEYCGFCSNFGCEHFAKASPQACILPVALKNPNFSLRTDAYVLRITKTPDGRRATGVIYADGQGREIEQPADLVFLCAFPFNNTRLLLLSGIGAPYDPASGTGVVGRNFAYQTTSSVSLFFDDSVNVNPFMGAGALAVTIDDFNGDNFDHTGLGFVGGGYIQIQVVGGAPIKYHPAPAGTPRWGADFMRAIAGHYNHHASIGTSGSSMAHRGAYLDLDPTYKDAWGQPLLRMTFDFHDNDIRMSRFITDKGVEIGKQMGPRLVEPNYRTKPYSVVPYQTSHVVGGTAIGADPRTSVTNRYGQSWDVPNLFIAGASLFPQNTGYNPTLTVGAMTYWTVDAVKAQYLKAPGPLVTP